MTEQKIDNTQSANLLLLDRAGRVLVQIPDGYDFAWMSTDLRGAVVFDQDGAEDAITTIQTLRASDGPFITQSVRDFKMAVIDAFGTTPESDPVNCPTDRH